MGPSQDPDVALWVAQNLNSQKILISPHNTIVIRGYNIWSSETVAAL